MAPPRRSGYRSRRRSRGVVGTFVEDATEILQSVANEVAPGVVGAIDVNGVVQRVDFQAVTEQVDIQSILDRVDLNVLLQRVDVTALIERVDMDELVDRIDLDRVLGHIDINTLLARVDIDGLVKRTEMGSIIAATGSGVAAKVVDVARSQGVGLDLFTQRWVDRLLRRRPHEGLAPGTSDRPGAHSRNGDVLAAGSLPGPAGPSDPGRTGASRGQPDSDDPDLREKQDAQ